MDKHTKETIAGIITDAKAKIHASLSEAIGVEAAEKFMKDNMLAFDKFSAAAVYGRDSQDADDGRVVKVVGRKEFDEVEDRLSRAGYRTHYRSPRLTEFRRKADGDTKRFIVDHWLS